MRFFQKYTKKLLDMNLNRKLMGVYLFVTALPLIIVGLYLNTSVKDVVVNNAIFETEANLEKIEIQLETIIDRVTHISDLIYLNRDLDSLLSGEYETTFEMYEAYTRYPIFNDFLRFYDEIENIQFFMVQPMISDSYFISADEEVMRSDWFEQAVGKEGRISWIIKEDYWTKREYLTLTRAVYGQNQRFLGVLNIYVSSDKLRQLVQNEIHDVYIILDEQEIVFASNGENPFGYPMFLNGLPPEQDVGNVIYDHQYRGEDVKINLHRFRPTKSLDNTMQIASIIPVDYIMAEPNQIFNRSYFIIFMSLIFSVLAFQLYIKTINTRVNTLKFSMTKVAQGKFDIKKEISGKDEIGEAYDELYKTSQSLQKLIDEVYVHKINEERYYRKQKESEFKMLSSQINPHFLYNTLEMIRMKALVNKDRDVATLIMKLSKMMRRALESTNRPVPLNEELELIQTYLEIQAMRFGESFTFEVEAGEESSHYQILPLLIQPLVENAIIHGLEPKEERGKITINVWINSDHIEIRVADNGVGMSRERLADVQAGMDLPEDQDSKHIGIRNVHQRIQLYYGDRFGLKIETELGGGTAMILHLPKLNY